MKAVCRPCDVEQEAEAPAPACFCCGEAMDVVAGDTFGGGIAVPALALTVAELLAL